MIMGKRPVKNPLHKQLKKDRGKANRRALPTYTYVPTDYAQALPSNLDEKNKTSYVSYTQAVTKEFCIEFARDLDEKVDNARGNGNLEGRKNKSKRRAHEKKYLRKLGVPSVGLHCETTPTFIAKNDTIPQVQGAYIFKEHPQESGCVTNNDKNYEMCRKNPEIGGGYVNIKEYVAEVQQQDPYCVIDTVVPSTGNVSGSGLHRVTIAPTIDENGDVVIDPETNLPQMTVYSFNNASKTNLGDYQITHGVCFNLNDYARHNLKDEYQNNPVNTQEQIDEYNKANEPQNKEVKKTELKDIPRVSVVSKEDAHEVMRRIYDMKMTEIRIDH